MHQNMIVRVLMPADMVILTAVLLPLALGPARQHLAELLAVWVVAGLIVPIGLLCLRMVTVVTDRRLVVKYTPFPGREIDLRSIREATPLTYRPLPDAGGWGWRISRKYHRVLNVSGDRGVHVRYGESKQDQVLLGSRRPEELAGAIARARGA